MNTMRQVPATNRLSKELVDYLDEISLPQRPPSYQVISDAPNIPIQPTPSYRVISDAPNIPVETVDMPPYRVISDAFKIPVQTVSAAANPSPERNMRQVPANLLSGAGNYIAQHPWQTLGATAVLGGLAGAVMAPPTGYSPQEIITASQTDKDSLIDQMARQGIYSNEELLAATKLSSDELVQFLAQEQRAPGNAGLGFLVGAGVGAGLGAAGLNMLYKQDMLYKRG